MKCLASNKLYFIVDHNSLLNRYSPVTKYDTHLKTVSISTAFLSAFLFASLNIFDFPIPNPITSFPSPQNETTLKEEAIKSSLITESEQVIHTTQLNMFLLIRS